MISARERRKVDFFFFPFFTMKFHGTLVNVIHRRLRTARRQIVGGINEERAKEEEKEEWENRWSWVNKESWRTNRSEE